MKLCAKLRLALNRPRNFGLVAACVIASMGLACIHDLAFTAGKSVVGPAVLARRSEGCIYSLGTSKTSCSRPATVTMTVVVVPLVEVG